MVQVGDIYHTTKGPNFIFVLQVFEDDNKFLGAIVTKGLSDKYDYSQPAPANYDRWYFYEIDTGYVIVSGKPYDTDSNCADLTRPFKTQGNKGKTPKETKKDVWEL